MIYNSSMLTTINVISGVQQGTGLGPLLAVLDK